MNNGLSRTVVDVLYYNLFDEATFKNMTVQQNIDYIKTTRAQTLQSLVSANGPLIFVGKYEKSVHLTALVQPSHEFNHALVSFFPYTKGAKLCYITL